MGQKVSPVGLRVGVNRDWDSRWYANDQDFAGLLHEDIMDEILQYIQSYLRKYRVSIYDRKRHKGLLRHVLIRRAVKTDQTMVVLVCNENMWRGSKQF